MQLSEISKWRTAEDKVYEHDHNTKFTTPTPHHRKRASADVRCLTETTVILRARHSRLCQKKKADHMTSLSLCLSHTIHLPPPGWEVSCVGVSLYIQHLFSAAATLCNMSTCQMACQSSRNSFISVSTHKTLWLTSWIPINVLQSNRDFFFLSHINTAPQ